MTTYSHWLTVLGCLCALGAGGCGSDDSGENGSGAGGTSGTPSELGSCESGETTPCGVFNTRTGQSITLGPYGAIMDVNVGEGFEVPIAAGDQPGSASCTTFGNLFGDNPELTAELMDVSALNMALYSVYRPANMVEGEKYPIITWGNGTCAQPEGYGALLRYVASHGFFVFAAHSRYVGGNSAMIKALDFAFAANDDSASPYYQRLDTSKVGAMGHSQGSGATASAASDARIQAVILFNGGTSASKPFLAVGGDRDVGGTLSQYQSGLNGATKAAFVYFHQVENVGTFPGHLVLMKQPDRVIEFTADWWQVLLNGDAAARDVFVGESCLLCERAAEFDYGQKGL
jgi:hypothetical protein